MKPLSMFGMRTVYSWREVGALLGMHNRQVQWLVATGRLIKRSRGLYPFFQHDVKDFILRFNAGQVRLGLGRGKRKKEPHHGGTETRRKNKPCGGC